MRTPYRFPFPLEQLRAVVVDGGSDRCDRRLQLRQSGVDRGLSGLNDLTMLLGDLITETHKHTAIISDSYRSIPTLWLHHGLSTATRTMSSPRVGRATAAGHTSQSLLQASIADNDEATDRETDTTFMSTATTKPCAHLQQKHALCMHTPAVHCPQRCVDSCFQAVSPLHVSVAVPPQTPVSHEENRRR